MKWLAVAEFTVVCMSIVAFAYFVAKPMKRVIEQLLRSMRGTEEIHAQWAAIGKLEKKVKKNSSEIKELKTTNNE